MRLPSPLLEVGESIFFCLILKNLNHEKARKKARIEQQRILINERRKY